MDKFSYCLIFIYKQHFGWCRNADSRIRKTLANCYSYAIPTEILFTKKSKTTKFVHLAKIFEDFSNEHVLSFIFSEFKLLIKCFIIKSKTNLNRSQHTHVHVNESKSAHTS